MQLTKNFSSVAKLLWPLLLAAAFAKDNPFGKKEGQ
jgi:hypothetical protein